MVEGKRKKGIIFNHTSISTELKVVRSSKQDASHRTIKEMCIFFFSRKQSRLKLSFREFENLVHCAHFSNSSNAYSCNPKDPTSVTERKKGRRPRNHRITRYLQRYTFLCPFVTQSLQDWRIRALLFHRMGIYASKKEAAIKIFRHRCVRGRGR